MTAHSISEVALRIGRNRSQLYRLINDGSIRDYLRLSPTGKRLLELAPQGLPTLAERVASCTQFRISSKPRPEPAPEYVPRDIVADLWAPMTPQINRELAAQGLPTMEPEQVLAVTRAIDDVISRDFPVHDTYSREWWADWLKSEGEDPWRCEHCGEPWNPKHPDYRRPDAGERS